MVARQADIGLDVVNDGEFGKSGWSGYALARVTGFEVRKDQLKPLDWLGRDRERFRGFFTDNPELPAALTGAPAQVCVGPIKYTGTELVKRDLANLKAATAAYPGREVFFTSVAPASTAYSGVNEYYKTDEEYVYAIAEAMRQEYLAIHEAGFILQVDDAVLANMYDHLSQQGDGAYERWARLRVEALNHALAGIPEDRIRYHICFGSWHVPHVADAPLEAIVDLIVRRQRGRVLHRGREPAARVGVGGVGEGEAPGRQDPHPRRHQPPHDHGRAPAARRPAAGAVRADPRPGERDRRRGLRIRPVVAHPAHASRGGVGQIRLPCHRSPNRVTANLGFLTT